MPAGGGAVAASDLKKCFVKFDKNDSGNLSFDELLAIMTNPLAKIVPLTAAEMHEAKVNFERYDLDGDGVLSMDEFVNAWTLSNDPIDIGPPPPVVEIAPSTPGQVPDELDFDDEDDATAFLQMAYQRSREPSPVRGEKGLVPDDAPLRAPDASAPPRTPDVNLLVEVTPDGLANLSISVEGDALAGVAAPKPDIWRAADVPADAGDGKVLVTVAIGLRDDDTAYVSLKLPDESYASTPTAPTDSHWVSLRFDVAATGFVALSLV